MFPLPDFFRKFFAGKFFALHRKADDDAFEFGKNAVGFPLHGEFALRFPFFGKVLLFDFRHGNFRKAGNALEVFGYAFCKIFFLDLADGDDFNLQHILPQQRGDPGYYAKRHAHRREIEKILAVQRLRRGEFFRRGILFLIEKREITKRRDEGNKPRN